MQDWRQMDREQRGIQIAAISKIDRKGGVWIVPSQSGSGRYTVCPDSTEPHCTCPDHATTGGKCKHLFAVEFVLRRERNPDGSITETTVTMSNIRKTYPQNWSAYNAAQTNEKSDFQMLLYDLCQLIEPPPRRRGRPSLPMSDMVFAVAYKVYSTFSGRRFISDLTEAHQRGYLTTAPHFNSIFNIPSKSRNSPRSSNI